MSGFEADPRGTDFSGEPASMGDIAIMEKLASELIVGQPCELVRSYEKTLEDVATLELKVVQLVEDDGITELAAFAVSSDRDEGPKFELVFGADNSLVGWHYSDADQLKAAANLASDLIESGILEDKEIALLRHMRHLILVFDGQPVPGSANIANPGSGRQQPVVDVIRELVQLADPPTMQLREYGHVFDDQNTLQIIEHKVTGVADPIDILEFAEEPQLQIEYQDRGNQTNHCYVVTVGNRKTYESYDPADLLEAQIADEEPGQNTAEEMTLEDYEELKPTKAGVELLTLKIIDATASELVPDSFRPEDVLDAKPN